MTELTTNRGIEKLLSSLMYTKIANLRKMAMHVGLVGPAQKLIDSSDAIARHFPDADGQIKLSLAILKSKDSTNFKKSLHILILDCISPDWKNNLKQEDLGCFVSRISAEVRQWRLAVLGRDDRTCVRCGSQDRPEAHHIAGWADTPHLRVVVSNGVTLCYKCHKAEHEKT